MKKRINDAIALSVRTLTMDAVQKANSGHPGLPMGLAEMGALLYGDILNINPDVPDWIDRDRLVLSAGHGCMLLYSLLHLSGFPITLDDIKNFRQFGSKTPGHPEYAVHLGIETTTGPLGQGFANGVGMALAAEMLAVRFNTSRHRIIDHFTYVISGDGCMMEGVTSEAASLAGHLGLGKLIVFYDSNRISIEGSTELAFTENVAERFDSYHWQVFTADAYDIDEMSQVVEKAQAESGRPSLIVLNSIIAKGSPHLAGSHEAHGAPLGQEEVRAAKKSLGIDEDQEFFIHPDAVAYFDNRKEDWKKKYENWHRRFRKWSEEEPELLNEWNRYFSEPDLSGVPPLGFKEGDKIATRSASGKVLNALAGVVPNLVGGSADLAPSNKTNLAGMGDIAKGEYAGRNLHFGVREHGMASIVNGMALHGGIRPFCATFMVFTDYMRPPMRLAAMMKLPVVYILTHDSVYVGEDGPTHQPVEHLAALRVIPGMTVLRPADAQETEAAWRMILRRGTGPVALALTRQDVEILHKDDSDWHRTIEKGAYVVKKERSEPDLVIVATGSEVGLAVEAAAGDPSTRVVSMLSREIFSRQSDEFRNTILPPGTKRLVIEAAVSSGWEGLLDGRGRIVGIDRFGESGSYQDVTDHLGFTAESIRRVIAEMR